MGGTISWAALAASASLVVLVSGTGCDNSDPGIDVPPDTTTWLELGPADVDVGDMRLFNGKLYADGRSLGLLRLDLTRAGSSWEFLGLDGSISNGTDVGIADVAVTAS